jgi:hypothetical protein
MAARLEALLPRQIQVGPQLGGMVSRLSMSGDYRALIRPAEAEEGNRLEPSWGGVLTARWGRWFTLTLAPRRESYRLATHEETVSFPDNPYPHTLQAATELDYNVWPLILGMGWFGMRQHVQMQIGVYRAYLDRGQVRWIVDGEHYGRLPGHSYRKSHDGLTMGAEYGFGMGPGKVVLGVEAQRGMGSLMDGLRGRVRTEASRIRLAYGWTLFQKH